MLKNWGRPMGVCLEMALGPAPAGCPNLSCRSKCAPEFQRPKRNTDIAYNLNSGYVEIIAQLVISRALS